MYTGGKRGGKMAIPGTNSNVPIPSSGPEELMAQSPADVPDHRQHHSLYVPVGSDDLDVPFALFKRCYPRPGIAPGDAQQDLAHADPAGILSQPDTPDSRRARGADQQLVRRNL